MTKPDLLDEILEAVENNGALYNGDIPMTLTPPMSRIKAKAQILKHYRSVESIDTCLNDAYRMSITDMELAEYQEGEEPEVIKVADIRRELGID